MFKYIIVILAIILIYHFSAQPFERIGVQNEVYRRWNVIGSYSDSKEAAATLGRLNERVIRFMRYLSKKYHIGETDDQIAREGSNHISAGQGRDIAFYILRDYNPDMMFENDPRFSNDTSWTVNKGDSMYMCLRDKGAPNAIIDDDTLMFVALHEIAHIANRKSWGHERDFWVIFRFILVEAVAAGVYTPVDYSAKNKMYCGLNITYNPLYDASLDVIH